MKHLKTFDAIRYTNKQFISLINDYVRMNKTKLGVDKFVETRDFDYPGSRSHRAPDQTSLPSEKRLIVFYRNSNNVYDALTL